MPRGRDVLRRVALVAMLLGIGAGVTALGVSSWRTPVSAAGPGLRAHVDPETGELLREPPPSVPGDDVLGPRTSIDDAGLQEEPVPLGGTLVRLRGRFRSSVTATVEVDGSATATCHGPEPGW